MGHCLCSTYPKYPILRIYLDELYTCISYKKKDDSQNEHVRPFLDSCTNPNHHPQ